MCTQKPPHDYSQQLYDKYREAFQEYITSTVYLHTAPLCHIGGLSSALAMLMVGGCHVLVPKFEARLALEAIDKHEVTFLITVYALMLANMVSVIRTTKTWERLLTISKILNGGGSLSVELLKDAIQIFPRSKILSAYGVFAATLARHRSKPRVYIGYMKSGPVLLKRMSSTTNQNIGSLEKMEINTSGMQLGRSMLSQRIWLHKYQNIRSMLSK